MFKLEATGNLTDDPRLGQKGDITYCNFTVAAKSGSETSFVDTVVFGNHAKACFAYLQKGSVVRIAGMPDIQTWNDKETSEAKGKIKCKAREVEFLARMKSKEQVQNQDLQNQPAEQNEEVEHNEEVEDDFEPEV